MSILSFIVVTLLALFGVSAAVEFYKKTIRKGNAKSWENWLVGGALSVGMAALLCFTGIAYAFFANPWINTAIYAVVFFVAQFFLDMKVIKKLLASALQNADIQKILDVVLPKVGLTVEKIKNFLTSINVDRKTLEAKLVEAGVTPEKAKEIADAIFGQEESK